jgi:hypothetical protein
VSTETDQTTVVADTLADRLAAATLRREGRAVVAVLADRQLRIESIPGPGGERRWQVTVSVDGDTVTKNGPFTAAAAVDHAVTLADEPVGYTVCCDGRRS